MINNNNIIVDYIIITDTFASGVQARVCSLIDKGFQPRGELIVSGNYAYQVMVKYEK